MNKRYTEEDINAWLNQMKEMKKSPEEKSVDTLRKEFDQATDEVAELYRSIINGYNNLVDEVNQEVETTLTNKMNDLIKEFDKFEKETQEAANKKLDDYKSLQTARFQAAVDKRDDLRKKFIDAYHKARI